jgi:hypothetical protein
MSADEASGGEVAVVVSAMAAAADASTAAAAKDVACVAIAQYLACRRPRAVLLSSARPEAMTLLLQDTTAAAAGTNGGAVPLRCRACTVRRSVHVSRVCTDWSSDRLRVRMLVITLTEAFTAPT